MNRRDLLKFLISTPVAMTLDVEKLLWVPKPMIVVPGIKRLSESQIVTIEMERILPKIKELFERDDTFYRMLKGRKVIDVAMGPITAPLILKSEEDGDWDDEN